MFDFEMIPNAALGRLETGSGDLPHDVLCFRKACGGQMVTNLAYERPSCRKPKEIWQKIAGFGQSACMFYGCTKPLKSLNWGFATSLWFRYSKMQPASLFDPVN